MNTTTQVSNRQVASVLVTAIATVLLVGASMYIWYVVAVLDDGSAMRAGVVQAIPIGLGCLAALEIRRGHKLLAAVLAGSLLLLGLLLLVSAGIAYVVPALLLFVGIWLRPTRAPR